MTKLSALTELSVAPALTDELYIRDESESAANESKRILASTLLFGTGATLIVAANDSTAQGKLLADYICDGTADQTEINNAITALPAGGGKVLLLEGLYYISGSITIKSKTWLCGSGWGTVIKVPNATASQILMIINGAVLEEAIVSHLCLDGNLVNATGENFGFMFYPNISRRCIVTNCLFTDFREVAIASYPQTSGFHYGNIFVDNIIKRCRSEAITLFSSYYCTVTNNTILDGLGHEDTQPTARDFAIKAGRQGGKTDPHSCKITNNTIVRWRSGGIKAFGDHHKIQNNTVRDCSYGAGSPAESGISITGDFNTIKNNDVTDYQDDITSLLTGDASSGQKVVAVTDGSLFYKDITVTISDDSNSETNEVASISSNNLTMYNNLANTYTTAANAKVTGQRTMREGIQIVSGDLNVVHGNNLYRSVPTAYAADTLEDNGTNTRKRDNIGNDGAWLTDV